MANNFRFLLLDGDGLGDTDKVVGTVEVVEVVEGVETSPGIEAVRTTAHEVGCGNIRREERGDLERKGELHTGSCECTSKDGRGEEWHLEHCSM